MRAEFAGVPLRGEAHGGDPAFAGSRLRRCKGSLLGLWSGGDALLHYY